MAIAGVARIWSSRSSLPTTSPSFAVVSTTCISPVSLRINRCFPAATGVELKENNADTWNDLIDSGAFCVGDPEQVIEKVNLYRKSGADRLVSVMQLADLEHQDLMRSIELMGTKVIPAIRELEASDQA